MDAGLTGSASAFLSTASYEDFVAFFRYLGEDVSALDGVQCAEHVGSAFHLLPTLADRALRKWTDGSAFPGRPAEKFNVERFKRRDDLPGVAGLDESDSSGGTSVASERPLTPVPNRQPSPAYDGGGGSPARRDQPLGEEDQLRENVRRLEQQVRELADPRKQFEQAQRFMLEPAMQQILRGKLSEVQIQRMRAYRIEGPVIDKLIKLDVLPPGWKENKIFGKAAFRPDLPRAQQLPMSEMDRAILEGEVAFPENFPERERHYSWIKQAEHKLLKPAQKKAITAANDSIQNSLGELRYLLFMCAALADESIDAEERCTIALQFAALQSRFIFDEIAQCEQRKMQVATLNLTDGTAIPFHSEREGVDVLDEERREEIDTTNASVAAVAQVRKHWNTLGGAVAHHHGAG